MLEEKITITLDQKQTLELDGIILDKDKDAAYKFLEDCIYKPVKKTKSHITNRHFRGELLWPKANLVKRNGFVLFV